VTLKLEVRKFGGGGIQKTRLQGGAKTSFWAEKRDQNGNQPYDSSRSDRDAKKAQGKTRGVLLGVGVEIRLKENARFPGH